MKLDPQNEEHRVLIESIEETFALFFGQMAVVEAFSEMVDSFYAQMDEQVDELENIMHEVLEPLDALEKSIDEAIENFMRYFDAPESPIRQVEELLCGEDETTTRFGKVILEELDRDSARYHVQSNRYLDMNVTVSGFHIANSRDCDLLSDRVIEVMEQVHILWEKGKIEGDRNIRVIINDLTVPITNIEVPQKPIETELKPVLSNVILGIHTRNGGNLGGHAWLALYEYESGDLITTYGAWSDNHTTTVDNGFFGSDLRKDRELDTIKDHSRYFALTEKQKNRFEEYTKQFVLYSLPWNNCSSWASEGLEYIFENTISAKLGLFGIERPKDLGQNIEILEKERPTSLSNPVIVEN